MTARRPFAALLVAAFLVAAFLLPAAALAQKVVVDQLGRKVTVPDAVSRIVVLQHQTLNLLVQMNATDRIVGVLDSWKTQLGAPTPGRRRG